ncbi:MAG: phosphodiesterase YaeI [Verrucomicrobiota bacterium]
MPTRRKFIITLGAGAAAVFGGITYARWGEPRWLDVQRVRVPLAREPGAPPLRVLQLSDFHDSAIVPRALIAQAITLGLAERPDVIALTGDFFTNVLRDGAGFVAELARLAAAAPTFACLGNHDGGPWTGRCGGYHSIDEALALLRAANITCLHNDSAALTLKGRAVQLVGVGDFWSGMCQPTIAFARAPARAGALRILLNHNPDAKDLLREFDWDLVLCGHTHGGQLRLPLLGTPFAPVVDKRYVEGLHRWQDRWLYVTRGVGNLHGLRFNCRPQVSVIDVA